MNFYQELQTILCQDAGARGLAAAVSDLPAAEVMQELGRAQHAILVTGFPVQSGHQLVGETDGPVGTAHLAAALSAAGCKVTVITDTVSSPMVKAALDAAAPRAMLYTLPSHYNAEALIHRLHPSHLITLERPGKAADGHFYSMRGRVLDEAVTETDSLFAAAKAAGVVTIAVGDGGNELGMGALYETIQRSVPLGDRIASVQKADYTLVAGVSNWWGWGMAALLSVLLQKDVLPDIDQDAEVLAAVTAAGGVDGCTGKNTLSVDGLSEEKHQAVLQSLRCLTGSYLNQTACLHLQTPAAPESAVQFSGYPSIA